MKSSIVPPGIVVRAALLTVAVVASLTLVIPTAWATGSACHKSPPSVRIGLPLNPEVLLPAGRTLVGLNYTVKTDGLVQVFLRYEYHQGYLGVQTSDVTEEVLPPDAEPFVGREIRQVVTDTPAAQAGLRAGDIIVAFNGEPVMAKKRFQHLIETHSLDKPVQLEVLRGEEKKVHQIRLGSRRLENEEFSNFRVPTHSDRWHSGLVLGEITTNVARYLPAPSRQGAIVLDIAAGSPAFASRLRVGDIITSLGEGFADSPAEMVETIARAASKGESLKISARRGEQRIETSIRPVADAQSSSELDIPILLEYRKRADRTRFEVGFGWVMDYDRDSCFDSGGDPYDKWSFGMLFDLFEIRRTREKTEFNLLWLIRLSW